MTYDRMLKGLAILAKHAPEGLDTSLCAEHDQIYCLAPGEAPNIHEDDLAALKALGFHYSDSDGWYCFT